ncbi:heterokaryon incompatibility protein-domain-containing protein [Nemania sp. FL0916]|nr:heterokaryon incompatibility protein-domain-containing protein [Nemania sp. FL0916]
MNIYHTQYPETRITSQLIKIQKEIIRQGKSLEFIAQLECLIFSAKPHELRRWQINAFIERRYVALSYTWDPSPFETDRQAGGYHVQDWRSKELAPSKVRDNVFHRIRRYMDYKRIEYLWIDQHGIEQQDGEEKKTGMNAMDRVYSLSKHPVALLTRPIILEDELRLLVDILEGKLATEHETGFCFTIPEGVGYPDDALRAVRLLEEITSDTWFTRGWTFQENHRGNRRMKLLIPHAPKLSGFIKPRHLLGSLDGELCISSVVFHNEAMKLSQAFQRYRHLSSNLYDGTIATTVGEYAILPIAREDQREDHLTLPSMTPRIIENLVSRELETSWDRIPIAANCCQYSVRLDSDGLRDNGYSLSLSLLALCLLNGEILSNDKRHDAASVKKAQELPIAEFLKKQLFNKVEPLHPEGELRSNKERRFADVKLVKEGIRTCGHLWWIDRLLPTQDFPRGDFYNRDSNNRVGDSERWRLRQLVTTLYERDQPAIANRLDKFLEDDYRTNDQPHDFVRRWQAKMAHFVALAIQQGEMLCTTHLIGGPEHGCAIIVTERAERVLFTAYAPKRDDSDGFDFNDIDKHVSIEVDCDNLAEVRWRTRLPRLYTGRWVHGLYFFDKCPQQEVIFPWPAALRYL